MPKTIRAVFEHGLFRPTEPVDLPDPCEVEVEVRTVAHGPDGVLPSPPPPATWDDFFATKLAIGSAPAGPDEEDLEVTGDDLLF